MELHPRSLPSLADSEPGERRANDREDNDREDNDREDMVRVPSSRSDLPTRSLHPPRDGKPEITGEAIPTSNSAWLPLTNPTFRLFWTASLISNLGTWIHEVGAGWLMTSLDADPSMVSGVRVAMSLPIMFLAIPMGGLIDRVSRRTSLMVTTIGLLLLTATLTGLTYRGMIGPWGLLAFTFGIGIGVVGHMLAWQSSVPELVPREQLSRAVALGSISFNMARAVGPAISGLLIAVAGSWLAFGINAASFFVVLGVVVAWRTESVIRKPSRRFLDSLREGFQHCRDCQSIRATLWKLLLFVLPASSLWSLLPLYVRKDLGWNSLGFGVSVTLLGSGALVGAMFLHRGQQRFGFDRTVWFTTTCFSVALAVAGRLVTPWVLVPACLVMGAAWMMTLTTLNSNAQMNLPSEVRGRGMSFYVTTMSFSMVAGSWGWGQVASRIGVPSTMVVAGVAMLVLGYLAWRTPMEQPEDCSEPVAAPSRPLG